MPEYRIYFIRWCGTQEAHPTEREFSAENDLLAAIHFNEVRDKAEKVRKEGYHFCFDTDHTLVRIDQREITTPIEVGSLTRA